jgi:uncharacterized protein
MSALRELISAHPTEALAIGGLLIGIVFGAIAQRTNFCTLGAVSDWINLADTRRLRAWALATSIAVLGVALLEAGGVTEVSRSIYLRPRINWLGSLAGGLMFGFGMALAGGCPSRNLVRAGGGDVKSAVTLLLIALFAGMSLGGVLGPLRHALEFATAIPLNTGPQGLGDLVAAAFSQNADSVRMVIAALAGLTLAAWAFATQSFRSSGQHISSGILIGLLVVAGWALTGLAYDEMAVPPPAPPASLSFVKPTVDAVDWLQRFTAQRIPGFGAATVFGTLMGSCLMAFAMRRFRVTSFADTPDALRHAGGAALMGIGGVMGLGCSIGQGITGVSTLAIGSLIAAVAIVTGAVLGLKFVERSI